MNKNVTPHLYVNKDSSGDPFEKLGESLTELQLLNVVKYWYSTKMPEIFQNENGIDLEEFVDEKIYEILKSEGYFLNPDES
jgi:hypothetical protein